MLAGRDQCAVDVRKVARMLRQRHRQRTAADHLGADRGQQLVHIGALGLVRQRGQRLIQRQAGDQQAGELARHQRVLLRREPLAETGAAALGGLRAERVDHQRCQPAGAQHGARLAGTVGFDDALVGAAGGVGGFVAEGWHGGS